jgi:elongation factor 2
MKKKKLAGQASKLMDKPEQVRNICIIAHVDHGKTTFVDNLLAGAGLISKDLAGTKLVMDSDEEEQKRGITINSGFVSYIVKL